MISITAGLWLYATPAFAQDALDEPAPAGGADLGTASDDDHAGAATPYAAAAEASEVDADGTPREAEYEALVLEALEAYREKEWTRARELFQRAHAITPTARTLRTMGMCAFNQGEMVAALVLLERALVDERRPLTDEQRGHVRELIRRADATVGRVRLVLEPADAQLRVGGKEPTLLPDGQLVLEPGRHEITLSAPGYARRSQVLRVAAHDRATLELRLERDVLGGLGVAPPASDARAPRPTAAPHTRTSSSGRGWAWVALSVGVAGAVAGGATAAMALSEKSRLDEVCVDRKCGPADHGRVDEYETLRTISMISGAVGVLGLAGGAVLLWTSGEPERAPRVEAMIGPGFAGVRGRL